MWRRPSIGANEEDSSSATETHSQFIRVQCNECQNEQTVFSNVSTVVHCQVCNAIIAEPTGGKTHLIGKYVRTLS